MPIDAISGLPTCESLGIDCEFPDFELPDVNWDSLVPNFTLPDFGWLSKVGLSCDGAALPTLGSPKFGLPSCELPGFNFSGFQIDLPGVKIKASFQDLFPDILNMSGADFSLSGFSVDPLTNVSCGSFGFSKMRLEYAVQALSKL